MTNLLRQFIREAFSTSQQRSFGPDPDDFRDISTGIDADALERAGFKHIASGSTRAVYTIPNIDDKVLKIALRGRARKMNRYEADNQLQTAFPEFVPKVYVAADDFEWLIVERVDVIKTLVSFYHILDHMYPDLKNVGLFLRFHDRLHAMAKILIAGDIDTFLREHEIPYQVHSMIGRVFKQMSRLISMVQQFNINPHEIYPGNVGVRHGQSNSFVLLDTSIF